MRSRVFVIVLLLSPACLFPDLSGLGGDAATSDAQTDTPIETDASDAGDAGDAAAPGCDPTKPFSSIQPISELDDSDSQYKATLTPDELEIWWGSTHPTDAGSVQAIYHASRGSLAATFTNKAIEANIAPGDVDPAATDDGLGLYYSKFGTFGNWDFFETTRATRTNTFGIGFQLPSTVQSASSETASFVAYDKSLWFISARGGNNDVWVAPFTSGGLTTPVLVASLSSSADEYGVILSHDGLWAWVTSARTDLTNAGSWDIYVAHRTTTSDVFGALTNVTELNSASGDRACWISWDNCRLYFESSRSGNDDLFVASKTP